MSERIFEAAVPIAAIVIPSQPREYFDEAAQVGMDATVKKHGVKVALLLRRVRGKLYLWDGARRLRAAIAAGLSTVPAMIEEGEVAEADIALTQVLLNAQREDLLPLEKAKAIDGAMKITGASAKQVAAKLGTSSASVTRLLALLKLPEQIQKRVAAGEIPASSAYRIARIEDVSEQLRLAEKVAGGLTRSGLDAERKAAKRLKTPPRPRRAMQRVVAKLSGGSRVTVTSHNLTVDSLLATLDELLTRVRTAHADGTTLDTLCNSLTGTGQS